MCILLIVSCNYVLTDFILPLVILLSHYNVPDSGEDFDSP